MGYNTEDFDDSMLMIDYLLATSVARHFGLSCTFFKTISNRGGLREDIILAKQCGLLFVRLPKNIMHMIRDGYVPCPIRNKTDMSEFMDGVRESNGKHFIFSLTDSIEIGLWK